MDFAQIVKTRQSCRAYDPARAVEPHKLEAVMEAGRFAPSACNGQPYRFTVCQGDTAKQVAACVTGMGMNRFAMDAPVLIVISEEPYVPSAALGARIKKNDYCSIDIGIAAAYLTAAATEAGLGTCILGWFDEEGLRRLCHVKHPVRLAVTLGYPKAGEQLRPKKRKALDDLISEIE